MYRDGVAFGLFMVLGWMVSTMNHTIYAPVAVPAVRSRSKADASSVWGPTDFDNVKSTANPFFGHVQPISSVDFHPQRVYRYKKNGFPGPVYLEHVL